MYRFTPDRPNRQPVSSTLTACATAPRVAPTSVDAEHSVPRYGSIQASRCFRGLLGNGSPSLFRVIVSGLCPLFDFSVCCARIAAANAL